MKIGLFGGTFNPYHNGHFRIISHVRKVFYLDEVYLIPSAIPPHKSATDLAPANLRFEMVKESLKNTPGFRVSDKELARKGPSFTIDTISEFQAEYRSDTRFFLLMGSDAFLDITTWKQKDKIFETVDIIVMLRGDRARLRHIVSFIDEHVSKGYILNKDNAVFTHSKKKDIFICHVPKIDISSTMIRTRVKNKLSIKGLVPDHVETLIRTKELYI